MEMKSRLQFVVAVQEMSPNKSGRSEDKDEQEDEDVEKLESEVKEAVEKIHHCRTTLRNNLHSLLAAHSVPAELPNLNPSADGHDGALLGEEDKETAEKIELLRQKISSNVSAMPILLKRMKECISRIDNFNSHSRIINPAFKKRKSA